MGNSDFDGTDPQQRRDDKDSSQNSQQQRNDADPSQTLQIHVIYMLAKKIKIAESTVYIESAIWSFGMISMMDTFSKGGDFRISYLLQEIHSIKQGLGDGFFLKLRFCL